MRRFLGVVAVAGLLLVLGRVVFRHPSATPAPPETPAQPATVAHFPTHSAINAPAAEPSPEEPPATNFLARLLHARERKLTPEQIERYLLANQRSAASLFAAFQTTGDRQFLQEAMRKYPNDPKVAYTAATISSPTPEEKRRWLDTFKQADPSNALGNYLSAQDYLKSGQIDLAVQELSAAAGKPRWQDYAMDSVQNAEEAYLSAGFPPAEAKASAYASTLLPALSPMKQLGVGLGELAKSYQDSGDAASAQAALQMGVNIGQQLSSLAQEPVITTLVGLAVENIALQGMDPAAAYGATGQTVADRMNAITQQRADLKALDQQFQGVLPTLPEDAMASFYDREKTFGPVPAMNWILNKYGRH